MIDRDVSETVTVIVAPAGDVIVLDMWGEEDVRSLCGDVALIQVEPRRWWLFDAGDRIDSIAAAIGDHGSGVPIGGGVMRATFAGPGWRGLLMIAGLFDTEDPRFGPGAAISTILHHVPVRIAVASETICDVYFAASYAPTLVELWSTVIGIENVRVSPPMSSTIGTA